MSFAVPVVAAISHDEVDITDDEVEEGARLGFSPSVGWVVPVLGEDSEVFDFPGGFEDLGTAFVVVRGEIVIIPDCVDWGGGGEVSVSGVELAAVVVDALLLLVFGEVDVDVIAKSEVGDGVLGGHDVPEAFVFRDVARAGTEGDGKLAFEIVRWRSFE